ncbi:hypothetical protein SADUNF_Sadunf12G0044900 [Salix dunnii]|uniref:Uncharacterized protein n=1 Tax=Salix dunnii TaxID=1413687 RepID=A0A835JL44_9ROSI|nr:hypothetical protein SADUNF_Sadunf12G0044900 [Salix dunnii]
MGWLSRKDQPRKGLDIKERSAEKRFRSLVLRWAGYQGKIGRKKVPISSFKMGWVSRKDRGETYRPDENMGKAESSCTKFRLFTLECLSSNTRIFLLLHSLPTNDLHFSW